MYSKKNVAVGLSKLLYFTLKNLSSLKIDYILDINKSEQIYNGIKIYDYSVLDREDIKNINFYIFAVSNHSLRIIIDRLSGYGVSVNDQVFIYSDLFKKSFMQKINHCLSQNANEGLYEYVKKETIASKLSVHTTICGSWLFLEALEHTKKVFGHIAEVGCYEGGNMLIALKSGLIPSNKNVYLFDSFDGFPELSEFDPDGMKKGDYKPVTSLDDIKNSFIDFENVKIIQGFVPYTFSNLNIKNKYSLVFFDCDLYQPCLDTLNYFWSKLSEGGLMLIHDYFYEPNGFVGVEKATTKFCQDNNITNVGIWESTMAILRKE